MIEQIDNLLTKEECNKIIDHAKGLDMEPMIKEDITDSI